MQDKRLVNRLQNYWELIRRGKPMPEISQLNPHSIEDLWSQCMKLEALQTQGGVTYYYRFVGSVLAEMYGSDPTNREVDRKVKQYPMNIIVDKLDGVAAARNFLIDENQFVNGRGKLVKYRACLMPFGNETKGVTHIVVGFSGREFENA